MDGMGYENIKRRVLCIIYTAEYVDGYYSYSGGKRHV